MLEVQTLSSSVAGLYIFIVTDGFYVRELLHRKNIYNVLTFQYGTFCPLLTTYLLSLLIYCGVLETSD